MQRSTPNRLVLLAPLTGPLVPLEHVPDPVFAQKMVGDGVSVDPLDQRLLSPCDGKVAHIHPAGHAVAIAAEQGVEVLLHVGLDTVRLKGQGFTPRVRAGDTVAQGAVLIEFDADFVATHAKSLLTQIVVTPSDRVAVIARASGSVRAGQDPILELELGAAKAQAEGEVDGTVRTSEAILVPNPSGLHARPAAVLANLAKRFKSEVILQRGETKANAKSVVAVMGLEVGHGDTVVLVARGPDAEEALSTLVPLIRDGLGEEGHKPAPAPATMSVASSAAPAPRPASADPNLLTGVPASPGLAVGQVFQSKRAELAVPEQGGDPNQERRDLQQALEKAKVALEALQARLHSTADPGKAAIFAAHRELLDDPDLLEIAESAMAKGKSAAFAWKAAVETHARRLSQLRNELLAARANDLRDVGGRVLHVLLGVEPQPVEIPPESLLVAEELTPSEVATLDPTRVSGFCTTGGGATSHVAILARSLGLPAVAGIDPRSLDLPDGTPAIVDGSKGTLRVRPPAEELKRIRKQQASLEARRKTDLEHALEPAVTTDGHRIEVVANIGGLADARKVVALGGEGVGLLRSEFLFLERASAPTEDEQFETYRDIANELGPERPLIIRTLDVGGDKPLPYLPIPAEENPFLGERGLRIGLDRPEILRTQLRAILRASAHGRLLVMFPMVAILQELRDAKSIFLEECGSLGVEPIPLGIMVEIPSVALLAGAFAREADFFSIGTNDLTQYTLAMDRGHAKLASKIDGLDPSVLHLVAQTVRAAHEHQRWVGVCGGIAGDAQAVPILVGLGVDELSVSTPAIPAVKAQVRSLRLEACRELARRALEAATAAEVRAMTAAPGDDASEANR